MEKEQIKIGDLVRHRRIMSGTHLYVIKLSGDTVTVRYANQGFFATQDLYLHEVEVLEVDEDEYL